jgi:hypothetical protein
MRFAGPALTVAVLLAGGPGVLAQANDLSRANCGHLVDLPRAEGERLMVWLHGYYAGAAHRPIIEGVQFETAMQQMRELCGRDRTLPLLGAEARSIMLGEGGRAQTPSGLPQAPRP